MDDYQFCTACGKEMTPQMTFCPACGTPVPGTGGAQTAQGNMGQQVNVAALSEKVKLGMFLLFAGAIFSLIVGIYALVSSDVFVQMLVDYVAEYGDGKTFEEIFGMTAEAFEAMMIQSAYIYVACGAVCAVAGIFAFMQKFWMVTLAVAVAAMVLGFLTTLVGGILGILVCWYIYNGRPAFES